MTTTEPANPLLAYETLDIASNDAYSGGPMHDVYTVMRREAPILKARGIEPGFPEWFWAISRHADVVTVSRQFQTYSSAKKGSLMYEDRPDLDIARLMIDQDPPEHTRLRTQVNRGFTPRAMRLMEDHYREVSQQIVADAVEQGDVEFVTKVSAELPLIAIAEMLGVPVEDRHKVFDWSNRMIGSQDPDYGGGPEDSATASAELYMYFNALAAEKRLTPRNDIITILLGLDPDGNELPTDRISDHEFDLFMLLLTVAGNETTRNGISHGLLALIDHPERMGAAARPIPASSTRGRGDAALGHAGHELPAHGDVRRRAARHADRRGRRGRHAATRRPTATRTCSPIRSRSTSPARRTPTSRSAAAARTSASAPTSPGWRCGSCSRRSSPRSARSSRPGRSPACAAGSCTASSSCRCASPPPERSADRSFRSREDPAIHGVIGGGVD